MKFTKIDGVPGVIGKLDPNEPGTGSKCPVNKHEKLDNEDDRVCMGDDDIEWMNAPMGPVTVEQLAEKIGITDLTTPATGLITPNVPRKSDAQNT